MFLALPRPLRYLLLAAATSLLLACNVSFDTSDGGPAQVRDDALVWRGIVPAGASVMLRTARGDIDVVPSADDSVRVSGRMEWSSGDPDRVIRLSAAQDSAGVLVCAVWGDGRCTAEDFNANFNVSRRRRTDAKVHFRVEVPAGVRLDLVSIDGDIAAAAAAPVLARSINGDVRVSTAVGPVRAETMNGSVDARMMSLSGTDSVIVKTLNGDAFAFLPEAVDAVAELSVVSGSVSTDFALPVASGGKKASGALGAGGRVVKVSTLNGTAALRKLDAEGKSYP